MKYDRTILLAEITPSPVVNQSDRGWIPFIITSANSVQARTIYGHIIGVGLLRFKSLVSEIRDVV